MMNIGDWNRLAVLIGARGQGKSTFGAYLGLSWQREAGAYVIGHSLGGRLPRRLPLELGGTELPIVYHETVAQVRSGIFWYPERWHILAPAPGHSGGASADDLLHFAQDLSDSVRRTHWSKKHFGRWKHNSNHEGVAAPPIVCIIDEGIAVQAAGISRKEDNTWFLEFLISLRHSHIGLVWSQQDPTARSWRILEQATDLYVFREHHRWALAALYAAGAEMEQLEQIRTLPKFKYVHIKPGELDWRAAAREAEAQAKGKSSAKEDDLQSLAGNSTDPTSRG